MSPAKSKVRSKPESAPATCAGATIREHQLRNGLRVLLVERHLDPVVVMMIWYGVGSRHEREDEAGLSHFLEHMMFKGTPTYGKGEVDLITTRLGGSNNAFTTADHTAYWFELASDRWETALELEADRMQNLTLDPQEFAAEKAVVLEELSMGLDDPWRQLSEQVQQTLFGRNPYSRPVIGYADVLERTGPEDMRDYYRRFYHPGNATLVLCGDFRPRRAMELVRRHFGAIDARPDGRAAEPYRPPVAEPTGERRVTTSWDDPMSRLLMGWPASAVGTDDDFALDVISTVLTSGRLSRLHRRLVLEQGLATSVSTSNDARVEGGAFWLYAEAVVGVAPETLECAIDEELERLANEAVSAAELRHARAILSASEAYEGETVTDLAEHLGEYAVDAEWRLALELGARRQAVDSTKMREVARRLLSPARRVVGWSLPRESGA